MTDIREFRVGDRVSLRANGRVVIINNGLVAIQLDDSPAAIYAFPPDMLTNLSNAHDIDKEEADDLLDNEL